MDNQNINEYEPMAEAPSEQELATGFMNEVNKLRPNNKQNNKNKRNNENKQNNQDNQNEPTVPATINNVNENMNEKEEPISYSREEELIKYGNLNGLEPTNLAGRYHNIFEGEQRKRKTRKRKTSKRKGQTRTQSRKGQRQSRKGNARHK